MTEPSEPSTTSLEEGIAHVNEALATLEQPPHVTLTSAGRVIEAAISHGVDLYNEGDAAACRDLYAHTATRIIAIASDQDLTALPRTDEAIGDLARALQRASGADMAEAAAWALRHGFDKLIVSQQLAAEHVQWMMRLGEAAFMRGDYGGSADALRSAREVAPELFGPYAPEDEGIQIGYLAIIYHGHAMLLTQQYDEAYASLSSTVLHIPQLRSIGFDLTELGPHLQAFLDRQRELEALGDEHPLAPHAIFLRAYLHMFAGEEPAARELLEWHLARHPTDEPAQLLLAMSAADALA